MEHKQFLPEIKRTDDGSALVVIATLGVKDRDGDVILPGAFGEQIVPAIGAHEWRSIPIGKARVYERGSEALADITFNKQTTLGMDWYQAIKFDWEHPPTRQQYSWGFAASPENVRMGDHLGEAVRFLGPTPNGQPLTIFEVSPVLVGAGQNTRSLNVKEPKNPDGEALKGVVGPHKTATNDGPWDGPANERRVTSPSTVSYFRQIYAWQDPDGDATVKASWRFIHHFVGADGAAGAASTRACSAGIAVLNGGRGGTTVPGADIQGIYNHLAAHLRDAGREPPPLKAAGEESGVKLDDEMEWMLWDLEGLTLRLEEVSELRAQKGKVLSEARLDQIGVLQRRLAQLTSRSGEGPVNDTAVLSAVQRYESLRAALSR